MVDLRAAERNWRKQEARKEAIARASFKCPVVKQIEQTMCGEFLDIQHALNEILIDLERLPEAAATRSVISKVLKVGAV